MEKRTVPSFASFKPKVSSAAPAVSVKPDDEDRDRASSDSHQRRDRHSENQKGSRRHRHSSKAYSRERKDDHYYSNNGRVARPNKPPDCGPTAQLLQDEFQESDYFMIDRRGDIKNVEYGGLHRYSIPTYYRSGYGRVLGADEHAKIDRDASTNKEVVLRLERGERREKSERLLSKKGVRLEGRSQRLILPEIEGGAAFTKTSAEFEADFLPLRSNLKRKRGIESPERSVPDVDYRSVEGKATADSAPKDEDEDAEFESSSDEEREEIASDAHVRAQNVEFSRAVKAHPTDHSAWLALMEHQAQSTFARVDANDLTTSQRRSIADIQLSILDQAFKHIQPGMAGYDRLLYAYMTEGSWLWEASKLSQKWQDVLRHQPTSMQLWREYFNYVQTDHATFRYERCKEAYLECLEALSRCHLAEPERKRIVEDVIVYALLRFTRFISDAGYNELAISVWQALLEYHVLPPENFYDQSKLSAFRDFWDSDVPRIGEQGGSGWRTAMSKDSSFTRKTLRHSRPLLDAQRAFASFAQSECFMAKSLFFPAGTADEDDETNDPFRYVMFSDIRPILEPLPESLSTPELIDAFLCFMHLPPVNQNNDFSHKWQSDPHLQSEIITAKRCDSFSLFHDSFRARLPNEASTFVQDTLTTLTIALPDHEEMGEYLLALLSHTNPTETLKTAKRLLKSRSVSLRYYNAYALSSTTTSDSAERLDKAEKIWTTAMELSKDLPDDVKDDIVLLWHSWIMTLIQREDDDRALRVLLTVPNGSATPLQNASFASLSAGAVLRARRHFEEGFDRMLLKYKGEHLALYADCLAWLAYLSGPHDIKAALRSIAGTSVRLQNENSMHALELLHQGKARLLSRHTTAKRPFKPTMFRDELLASRRLFPENSIILGQYHEVARMTRLDDRLRDALSRASSASTAAPWGLISWAFAIDAEIARCTVDGATSTKDSVRAVFRRALLASDSRVKNSLALWRRWFVFETTGLSRTSGDETVQRRDAVHRARGVFFEGLLFLPWCKRWVVDGMAKFADSGDMGEQDLRQIHDILADRELRLRVDVDNPHGSA